MNTGAETLALQACLNLPGHVAGAESGAQHPAVGLYESTLEAWRRKALALDISQPQTAKFEAKT